MTDKLRLDAWDSGYFHAIFDVLCDAQSSGMDLQPLLKGILARNSWVTPERMQSVGMNDYNAAALIDVLMDHE